jgi:hypothetical protein
MQAVIGNNAVAAIFGRYGKADVRRFYVPPLWAHTLACAAFFSYRRGFAPTLRRSACVAIFFSVTEGNEASPSISMSLQTPPATRSSKQDG